MSSEAELKLKKFLKEYLSSDSSVSGVALIVNEEDGRIELITLNTTNLQTFLLFLHGLQALYDSVTKATNKTVH